MTTRSSGFTLIELLVVVAIIGTISAIGVVSYNGYVRNAQISSATNMLQQLSLGQTEFFTDNRIFNVNTDVNCPPTSAKSTHLSIDLFGGDVITEVDADGDPIHDFDYCADPNGANGFLITATATAASGLVCILTINQIGVINRAGAGCP